MEPRLLRRGNRSQASRREKLQRASMEPRLLRRGNAADAPCGYARAAGFNGATPSQTWKRDDRQRRRRASAWGFNGATPSQTWKRIETQEAPSHLGKLQWSHAFSDVETPLNRYNSAPYKELQWSHAFSDVETTPPGFNLQAWTLLQWSHAFSDVETKPNGLVGVRRNRASMEPRLLRRGNFLADEPSAPAGLASMEPRLLRRGNGRGR